jgi:hypothetical protein
VERAALLKAVLFTKVRGGLFSQRVASKPTCPRVDGTSADHISPSPLIEIAPDAHGMWFAFTETRRRKSA